MKNIKVTDDIEKEIVELSTSKSQNEIAILYNRSQTGVGLILKRNCIFKLKKSRLNMSRLSLKIDYFKEIDSNDKAYWLGFICADGNINKNNNKVSLTSKDLEVIEGFKEAIGAGHKTGERYIFDKRTNKTYRRYDIQIGNEIFTQHLINLGVTSNKSDVLKFPNIEEKYYPYFIAGLFDGDGSVSWIGKNKNTLRLNLISTHEILSFIKNYIEINMSIKSKYCYRITKNKSNVWKMYLYSDAYKLLKFIYFDDNFKYYLKRKYNMFLESIKHRNDVRHFRKIHQYDINMNLIKIWNSQKEIFTVLHYSNAGLNRYLKHGNKSGIYKNYIWKYGE